MGKTLAAATLALALLAAACGNDPAATSTAKAAPTATSTSTTADPSTSTSTDPSITTATTSSTTVKALAPKPVAGPAPKAAVVTQPPTTSDPAFPVTVRDSNGDVVISSRPKRIVSLSPTATETLYAIGAGPQVVAVDSNSNYPAEAPRTDLSGFKPNSEAVLKYQPDLVVLARGGQDVVNDLRKAGVAVLVEAAAADFADAEDQFKDLGSATGRADAGRSLAAQVKKDLADIAAATPRPAKAVTLYYEISSTYFSATSKTFIGKILSTLGTTNIADGANGKVDDYPQLSSEYIVASDPDLVLLADTKCCKQSAQTVSARSGWSDMTAVRNGDVVGLDDDIASRWGPRLPELLRVVAASVQRVASRR